MKICGLGTKGDIVGNRCFNCPSELRVRYSEVPAFRSRRQSEGMLYSISINSWSLRLHSLKDSRRRVQDDRDRSDINCRWSQRVQLPYCLLCGCRSMCLSGQVGKLHRGVKVHLPRHCLVSSTRFGYAVNISAHSPKNNGLVVRTVN